MRFINWIDVQLDIEEENSYGVLKVTPTLTQIKEAVLGIKDNMLS